MKPTTTQLEWNMNIAAVKDDADAFMECLRLHPLNDHEATRLASAAVQTGAHRVLAVLFAQRLVDAGAIKPSDISSVPSDEALGVLDVLLRNGFDPKAHDGNRLLLARTVMQNNRVAAEWLFEAGAGPRAPEHFLLSGYSMEATQVEERLAQWHQQWLSRKIGAAVSAPPELDATPTDVHGSGIGL